MSMAVDKAPESASDGTNNVAFVRVTLVGGTGSGKTSLASVFVNNVFPHEHSPTEDLTLYYSRMTLRSSEGVPFHALVEIEDTWASDKVVKEKMHAIYDLWWPLTQRESQKMNASQEKPTRASSGLPLHPVCRCGHGHLDHEMREPKACKIVGCNCTAFDSTSLEAPFVDPLNPFSSSMAPELWGVECSAGHTLKRVKAPEKENWKCNGVSSLDGRACKAQTSKHQKDQARYRCSNEGCSFRLCEECYAAELKALTRRYPNPWDCDPEGRKFRPLTRNRMVYFLVFDQNSRRSYEEALLQEKELLSCYERKQMKLKPIVYLVGNKIDVDDDGEEFQQVKSSAQLKSQREGTRYMQVSAQLFTGVKRLFREAVQTCQGRSDLWLLDHGIRYRDDEEGGKEKCCVQ